MFVGKQPSKQRVPFPETPHCILNATLEHAILWVHSTLTCSCVLMPPLAFENSWTACEGAAECPCPNHFPATLRLESVFRDPIDDDPSLYRLATGNDCPTPIQEKYLASSLSDTKSNMENVDRSLEKTTQSRHALLSELATVEQELQLLRDHRDQLLGAVERREQILAPIRRMPPEILAHILYFVLRKACASLEER